MNQEDVFKMGFDDGRVGFPLNRFLSSNAEYVRGYREAEKSREDEAITTKENTHV